MANNCSYTIKAVSDNPESLSRLARIMDYNDGEFYIYRVFSMFTDDIEPCGDGLFSMMLYGDVAWAVRSWFEDKDDPTNVDENTGATYHSLVSVCSALGINLEVWSEEYGVGFQEHGFISRSGTADLECLSAEYVEEEDRDDPDKDWSGGFDDYLEFLTPTEIWDIGQ